MNKERDPEKERRITEKMAKIAATERAAADRFKVVEEDRRTAEATGSALRKDQSRCERYFYVAPHSRISQGDGNEDEEMSKGSNYQTNNGFGPPSNNRGKQGGGNRGDSRRGRGGRGGKPGGRGGRERYDDARGGGRERYEDARGGGRERYDDARGGGRERYDDARGGGRERYEDARGGGRERYDDARGGGRERYDDARGGGRERYDDARGGGRERYEDARGGGRERYEDARGGGRGRGGRDRGRRDGGRHSNHPGDREWRIERVQADILRLDANRTEGGEWKRELDRGKEIPFASTRRNEDWHDRGPSGRLRAPPGRGGSASRGRGRRVHIEDSNELTVTVPNDRADRVGGGRGPPPVENGGSSYRSRRPQGRRGGRGRGRGRGQNSTEERRMENGRAPDPLVAADQGQVAGSCLPDVAEFLVDLSAISAAYLSDKYDEIPDLATAEGDVEDEYIDDTLEDLEDLDQYRLKIDLNEFTVDNPDLPDPILKKPIEFSWARAVSEEERCQKSGEPVRQFSGSTEIVWQDEIEEDEEEEIERLPRRTVQEVVRESMTITTVQDDQDDVFQVEGTEDEETVEETQAAEPDGGASNGVEIPDVAETAVEGTQAAEPDGGESNGVEIPDVAETAVEGTQAAEPDGGASNGVEIPDVAETAVEGGTQAAKPDGGESNGVEIPDVAETAVEGGTQAAEPDGGTSNGVKIPVVAAECSELNPSEELVRNIKVEE